MSGMTAVAYLIDGLINLRQVFVFFTRCFLVNNGFHQLRVVAFLAAVLLFVLFVEHSEAGWLIDEKQFHTSAHGQLSCMECHGDISERKNHPDPKNVNQKIEAFFDPAHCVSCHDEVMGDINAGTHGDNKANSQQLATYCIGCHPPHNPSAIVGNRPEAASVGDECGDCHEARDELPPLSVEDENCMRCHRSVPVEDKQIAQLCFHCHGSKGGQPNLSSSVQMPLIDVDTYGQTIHKNLSCRVCHPQSAAFDHANQPLGDCGGCHLPHDEKVAHDAHRRVACEACHLSHIEPARQLESNRISWTKKDPNGEPSNIHVMVEASDETACQRCHHQGNRLGAAAMILPAKSVMCAPCHVATLSVGDTITLLTMTLFFLGLICMGTVWFSGSTGADMNKIIRSSIHSIFSKRIINLLFVLVLDGLLLRRLYRMSKTRWLAHALIYYSMLFRFAWGVIGLIASLSYPEWSPTWIMLDKDHPVNAFLFDLTGLLMLIGVGSLVARRFMSRSADEPTGLPPKNWWGAGLLAFILVGGFLLEGMRIAMAGHWEGASYAFVGYAISALFSGFDLTNIYGYIWYGHAIITGVFLVCLPFNRMFHMLMAPLVLAVGAVSGHSAEKTKADIVNLKNVETSRKDAEAQS